jgi:integration host factor subunit beta
MTKADLMEEVSRAVKITSKESEIVVDAIFNTLIDALRRADKVEVRGFGSFRIHQRRSRVGRNPRTGARVEVPSKKIARFKPGKELMDMVNPAGKPVRLQGG